MKITAKVVPCVVGSSVTLHAESGMTICQLSLLSVIPPNFTFTPEIHKETSIRIAEWVASALNNAPAYETEQGSGQNLADANSKSPAPSSQSERIEVLCPHAPTYDAGLCCGHPDDCTFVSPSALVSGSREDGADA